LQGIKSTDSADYTDDSKFEAKIAKSAVFIPYSLTRGSVLASHRALYILHDLGNKKSPHGTR